MSRELWSAREDLTSPQSAEARPNHCSATRIDTTAIKQYIMFDTTANTGSHENGFTLFSETQPSSPPPTERRGFEQQHQSALNMGNRERAIKGGTAFAFIQSLNRSPVGSSNQLATLHEQEGMQEDTPTQ